VTLVMPDLPHQLYTASGVRELDHIAIEERNIAGLELMERAGQAAFDVLCTRWPHARKLAVVCGTGNNGGDGYIVARLAREAGLDVSIIQLGDVSKLKGDAKAAADKCHAIGLQAQSYKPELLKTAAIIVDALLGAGLDREPKGEWRRVIEGINTLAQAVLSLDIPSGLNADTGQVMGVAVKADATVSFIGMKQGLLTAQGPAHCGELGFAALRVPDDIYKQVTASARRIDLNSLRSFLPLRERDTHKGQCGHVLVIGGDYGYAGAVRMAGEAAIRVGAGLVTVATRPEHALNIPLARPELMTCAVSSAQDLNALLLRASIVVIGPGLGQSEWATSLLAKVLQTSMPLLVDADALNLLALEPSFSNQWILTPHPGEAARLLACSSAEVQADRFAAASALQAKYGGVCILKGSGSLVIDAEQSISVCNVGNPGMATGGMGDVLSGVIAGLMAQGIELADAARVGVCLHGAAADEAAISGERGMLASDLMPKLRALANP
jgi:ADP-dependent NAD(P)H-hydrate dehydratase / NAD(P)H-hydrate epimerase